MLSACNCKTAGKAPLNSSSYVTSVTDFGAKGDGKTDDTKAIESALSFCKKNNKNLFFPKGTYLLKPIYSANYQLKINGKNKKVNACIKIDNLNNFSISGEAGSQIIVDAHTAINFYGSVFSINNSNSINISNISIESLQKSIPKAELVAGVLVNKSDNITIDNIKIERLGSGIKFISSANSLVKECTVYDCKDTGLNFTNTNKNCIASLCKIGGCKDGNATMYGKNERCGFVNCTFTGREKARQLAVIESSTQCFITDCIFDGENNAACNGPILNRSQFCIVSGNIIKDVHYGMIVRDTDAADGGGVYSYGNTFSNNSIFYVHQKIKGQRPRGCLIEYSNNTKVIGNTYYRVNGPQIEIIDRKKESKGAAGKNANTIIKNNSFILKNSQQGDDLRTSFFCFDQPVLLWKGNYAIENLNFSDNSVFGDSNCKNYAIQMNLANHCIFSQNTFQDPNKITPIPTFINLGKGTGNTISNNKAGKIMISGKNNGLKIINNELSSPNDLINLSVGLSNSLISGNTFKSKKAFTGNIGTLRSVSIHSNFLIDGTLMGIQQTANKKSSQIRIENNFTN